MCCVSYGSGRSCMLAYQRLNSQRSKIQWLAFSFFKDFATLELAYWFLSQYPRFLFCSSQTLDKRLKRHGNEADFLGFLHKSVRHWSFTVHFEPFRFWLQIRGDIRNRKTTPRLGGVGVVAGNPEFCGPLWNWGPKKLYLPTSKTLRTGPYRS